MSKSQNLSAKTLQQLANLEVAKGQRLANLNLGKQRKLPISKQEQIERQLDMLKDEIKLEKSLADLPVPRARKKGDLYGKQLSLYTQVKTEGKRLDQVVARQRKTDEEIKTLLQKIGKCNYKKVDMVMAFFYLKNKPDNNSVDKKLRECLRDVEKLLELYEYKQTLMDMGKTTLTGLVKIAKQVAPHIIIKKRK